MLSVITAQIGSKTSLDDVLIVPHGVRWTEYRIVQQSFSWTRH